MQHRYYNVYSAVIMGNGKNKKNTHISRGKYKKRIPPKRLQSTSSQQNENSTPATSLDGNRIINLTELASFVGDVSSHTQSCQQGVVSLCGESNREGMASVLTARCDTCNTDISFATSGKIRGVGVG